MKTHFIKLLLVLLSTPGVLFSQQALFNQNQRIEITINGVKTSVYPDLENPQTDFWYEPGMLHIERKMEAGRSRLSFSMEVQPSEEDEQKPGSVTVNMVVNPVYSLGFEDELKKKLVEMGKTIVDPFKPLESYKLVNLKPTGSLVASIAFDELFGMAEWTNEPVFKQKKITLDRPFPVQLRLNHYDATILLESLLQKRTHRVGRVEYENGRYVPLYLSLAFDETSNPLDYQVESVGKSRQVVFSNPTEHPVVLQNFRFYSRSKGEWKTIVVNDTIPPFDNLRTIAPAIAVKLDIQPDAIEQVNWQALYDFKAALKLYVKSRMAAPLTKISVAIDRRPDERYLAPETLFDSVRMEFLLTDQFGLEHNGQLTIDLKQFAAQPYAVDSLFMSGFGGAVDVKYRFIACSRFLSSPFISRWIFHPVDFTGDNLFIDLRRVLNENCRFSGQAPLDGASVLDEVYMLEADGRLFLIPNSLKIATTSAGAPKVEFRQDGSQLRGYIEFFMPVFPKTLEKVTGKTGRRDYHIAKLTGAEITLLLDGELIVVRQALTPDGMGHLRLSFALDAPLSEKMAGAVKNESGALTCLVAAKWSISQVNQNAATIFTISL